MKLTGRFKVTATLLVLATVVIVVAKFIFLPRGPNLICHRALDGALQQWMHENGTNAFPNIDGDSVKSRSVLEAYLAPDELRDYVYVPGLRPGDPPELVAFYVKQKSRRRWHGDRPAIFREAKWVVLDPQFQGSHELAESIDGNELKQRLAVTLNYLKDNRRLHYENIVREQHQLLDAIRD